MLFDHINIGGTADLLEQLRDFYCRVFGMKVGDRPNFNYHGYWLYHDGKAIVHLVEANDRCRPEGTPHLDHIAFCLSKVDEFVVKLEQLGVSYNAKYREDVGMTRLFIHDPAGNRIELNFHNEKLDS